jgi:hypothetical protein
MHFTHSRFKQRAVISLHDIEHLRTRAARYQREAARAQTRVQFLNFRALAAHLEREANELECLTKSGAPSVPKAASSHADG